MNARSELVRFARAASWRLLLVVALALVVTGGTYAAAVSPVGTSMASTARRPPAKPADASAQLAGAETATTASADTTAAGASQTQLTQPQRPPATEGGGRGPSLTRGLPELGMHAVVIGVIVLALNVARSLWLVFQRRRGGNRAPIFHHAASGR